MCHEIGLDILNADETACITAMKAQGSIGRRLADLGFVPGTEVKCVGHNIGRDMSAFLVQGAVIALRREDSADILARRCEGSEA